MTVPEIAPITAKVNIDSTYYTTRLLQAKVTTEYGKSGNAEIFLDNFDYSLNGTFTPGKEAFIQVSKGTSYSDVKIFGGIIGNVQYMRKRGVYEASTNKDYNIVHLRCGDYTDLLRRNLITEVFTDGEEVGWDVADIVANTDYGLMQKYGAGVTTNNVAASTGVTLTDIKFPYVYVADALNQLADASMHKWYVDADKDLHFFAEETIESDETIDSDTLIGDFTISMEGDQIRNHVRIIGGDNRTEDTTQEINTHYDSLHDKYWADEFTPDVGRIDAVTLFIEKVGSPASDLYIEIREDNSNAPTGWLVTSGFESKERTATSPGSLIRIDISAPMDSNKKYWCVLLKTGDVSNTYRWYRDDSGSATDAYSADGSSWTTQSGTGDNHYMKTEYLHKIVNMQAHTESVATYGQRSIAINDASIMDRKSSDYVMAGFLRQNAFATRTIEGKIFPLDTIIVPGAKVKVIDTPSGINADYIMKRQTYDITDIGALEIDVTLEQTYI